MKTKFYHLITFAIIMIGCSSSHPSFTEDVMWEKLGQKTVNFGLDKDEIYVTAKKGSFKSIKLLFKGGAMNMHRCVVHYSGGGTQKIDLKKRYSAGDETRVIDLKGRDRIISKVVFWYDTKNLARRKSNIQLWGRH